MRGKDESEKTAVRRKGSEQILERLMKILTRNREMASYLVFGVLTTLVNLLSYAALTRTAGMNEIPAAALAWAVSVAFAYLTNKLFVFESRSFAPSVVVREAVSFILCRLFSGALDLGLMWLLAERLGYWDILVKVGSNIIVIILNFVFSKLLIFRKGAKQSEE